MMMTVTIRVSRKQTQHDQNVGGASLVYREDTLWRLGCRLLSLCWSQRHTLETVTIQRHIPEAAKDETPSSIPAWVLQPLTDDFLITED